MKPLKQLFYLIILSLFISLYSCTALKPYDKVYINDSEMQMGNSAQQNFQNYVQTIREGSTEPSSSKSSGGCGCN